MAWAEKLLLLYHRLPYPLKVLAASFQGYGLRRRRYGAETERLVEEAITREKWSATQWQAWLGERLAMVLSRAATQVPYYREQWAQRRRQGDLASWEYLENWPILEKEPLRANPRAFVAEDCNTQRMIPYHTSGTSGKPLTLWRSPATERAYYALFEARNRRWHGVTFHDRWAILGGKLVTPVWQRRPPFWVWNAGLNQLYMSSYHLAPDLIPFYLDALVRHRVKYIWGYTSSLYALALEILALKRQDIKLTVAIANAEPVFDYQRQSIGAAFQCPLRENYGMTELVAGAMECLHGTLHLWPEVGVIEVLEGENPLPPGNTGDMVGTSLINQDMPLIRYRVGDRGALSDGQTSCPCGRTLPVLALVEGRIDDVLFTTDGRRIGRLDPVFKGDLPIREAQIIQESLRRIRVHYVPMPQFTARHARSLIEQLQARLGPVEIILHEVTEVPREPSGKFRAVVCKIKTI
ncbi:MAG: phenylacetate--CoA ligase family protein [Desulfobaccales bacterium]